MCLAESNSPCLLLLLQLSDLRESEKNLVFHSATAGAVGAGKEKESRKSVPMCYSLRGKGTMDKQELVFIPRRF